MERVVLQPDRSRVWRLFLILVAGVIYLLWMVFSGDGILERATGAFFAAVLGWVALILLRGYLLDRSGQVAVSPIGLEFWLAGLPSTTRIFLPWDDVEWIGNVTLSGQEFTGLRLRSYRRLLAGISPEEAKALLRFVRGLRLLVYASLALNVANLRGPNLAQTGLNAAADAEDLLELANAVGWPTPMRDLAATFTWYRARCGAEILLSWAQRDRSADEFVGLLGRVRKPGDVLPFAAWKGSS